MYNMMHMVGEGVSTGLGVLHGESLHPPIDTDARAGLEELADRVGLEAAITLGAIKVGMGGRCMGTIAEMAIIEDHKPMFEDVVKTFEGAIGGGLSVAEAERAVVEELDSTRIMGRTVKLVQRDDRGGVARANYEGFVSRAEQPVDDPSNLKKN